MTRGAYRYLKVDVREARSVQSMWMAHQLVSGWPLKRSQKARAAKHLEARMRTVGHSPAPLVMDAFTRDRSLSRFAMHRELKTTIHVSQRIQILKALGIP